MDYKVLMPILVMCYTSSNFYSIGKNQVGNWKCMNIPIMTMRNGIWIVRWEP